MRKLFIAMFGAFVLVFSCTDKDALPVLRVDQQFCDSIPASYYAHVKPIFSAHCTNSGCHNQDAAGGINFSSYEEAKTHANTGKFVKAIRHEKGAASMPRNAAKLSTDQINTLECWILNNFPE